MLKLLSSSFGMIKIEQGNTQQKEGQQMKGYYTAQGFFGLVNGEYILFSCDSDYYDMLED